VPGVINGPRRVCHCFACAPLALRVLGRGPSDAPTYHIIVQLGCSPRGDTSEERRTAFRPAIPHFQAQHSTTSHKLPALAKPVARPRSIVSSSSTGRLLHWDSRLTTTMLL
jgi:hypothetical protein